MLRQDNLGFINFDWVGDIGKGIWSGVSWVGTGAWDITTDIVGGVKDMLGNVLGTENNIGSSQLPDSTSQFNYSLSPNDPRMGQLAFQDLPWYKQFWYEFEGLLKPAMTFGLQYLFIKELYPELVPDQQGRRPAYPSQQRPGQLTPEQEEQYRRIIEQQKRQSQMAVLIPVGLLAGGLVIFMLGKKAGKQKKEE